MASMARSIKRNRARYYMTKKGLSHLNKKEADGISYFSKNWKLYSPSMVKKHVSKLNREKARNAMAKTVKRKKITLFQRFKNMLARWQKRRE